MVRSSYILISLLGTMLLTLSACTAKKASESNTNGSSTIYVDSCRGEGRTEPVPENADWKISSRANLSFKACLNDTLTNKPFRGQKFEIEDMATGKRYFPDANDDNKDGSSDRTGCIVWHEPLDFNPLSRKSGTLELKRKLVAPGVNAFGVATFYADPWAMATNDRRNGGNSLQCGKDVTAPPDVIHASEPAKQKALLAGGDDNEQDGAELSINDIHVNQRNRQIYADGRVVDYAITMRPLITVYDRSNTPKPLDLTSYGGKFAIFAHLVATDAGENQDEKAILTMGAMSTTAKVEADGQIHTTLRTNLEKTTSFGNVSLAIRVVPIGLFGGQLPLKSFEYIYELGDIREMGDKTGTPNPDCAHHNKEKCNMLAFLKDANNFKKFEALRLAYKKEPLFFSTMKLRFVTIAVDPPETATRRTVTYSASTCITDTLTGAKVAKTPFYLEYVQDPSDKTPPDKDFYQKQTLMTDDEGCLRWIAHVTHQYYKPETFILRTVKIKMIGPKPVTIHSDPYAIPVTEFDKYNPKLKEIEREIREVPKDAKLQDPPKDQQKEAAGQELRFVLNPWDDKFTFGFDLRSGEVNDQFLKEVYERPKPESRFFTGGYGYHTIRFLYDFDRYMQMQVKKTILLEVDPRVLRYSGIVNARKTTENLRDGIYLLKVGIQKNFLDPATPGLSIYMAPNAPMGTECLGKKDGNRVNCFDRDSSPEALADVPKREYVTTKTALVRVVDGRLIKPIELTMRDLRLMRVRANFLIELETIDERNLALNEVIQKYYRQDLEELQNQRDGYKCKDDEKCYKEFKDTGNYPSGYERNETDKTSRKEATAAKWKEVYKKLDQEYLKPGSADNFKNQLARLPIGEDKPEDQKTPEQKEKEAVLKEQFGTDLLKALGKDFTQQTLPDCDRFDCEQFVENDGMHNYPEGDSRDNGLRPRTFVGPVIFLSNAYSDAVRATDNLDEVCRQDNPFLLPWQRKKIDDPDDQLAAAKYNTRDNDRPKTGESIPPPEDELFAIQNEPNSSVPETLPRGVNPNGSEAPKFIAAVPRENKSYIYSRYFNALSHLCYQSFDDDLRDDQYHIPHKGLKSIEHEIKQEYVDRMPKVAALPNFVAQYNMDFAVLDADNAAEYKTNEGVTVQENTISPQDIATKMSSGFSSYWGLKLGDRSVRVQWRPEQVKDLLLNFDTKTATQDQAEGVCHLMVNHVMSRMGQLVKQPPYEGWFSSFSNAWSGWVGANYPIEHPDKFATDLYSFCIEKVRDPVTPSIAVDKKLRVFQTGPHYTFRGGLQMNLNVGNSFSVSRGNSRGGGADFTDLLNGLVGGAIGEVIGGPVAARYGMLAGFAIKPYSFKSSDSMSDSTGTSVSAQTYLASQIAKFEVELMEWEQCRILRLSPSLLNYKVRLPFDVGPQFNAETMIGPDRKMQNTQGESLERLFSRGIMVCSGKRVVEHGTGKKVPEDYYYFTQHFTEGDMLDQADLLNHPWLLSLRGDRDFGAFITAINAQEDVTWKGYSKGMLGKELRVKADWPLDKLTETYKTITPSFPGIYTEVPEDETITPFPIGNRVINVDEDSNGEVCNRDDKGLCIKEKKILQPLNDKNATKTR